MSRIRIIGGRWRGRRIDVPDRQGLRPTPDRVRETLFNWLQADISGAHCLDLFAGTGALGLEALSRGAASVRFIDSDPHNIRQLQQTLTTLAADDHADCLRQDALTYLRNPPARPLDIVFIDPPYRKGLQQQVLDSLLDNPHLRADAWVYVEQAGDEAELRLPAGLHPHRSRRAGQVAYNLLHYRPDIADTQRTNS